MQRKLGKSIESRVIPSRIEWPSKNNLDLLETGKNQYDDMAGAPALIIIDFSEIQ